MLQKDYKTKKLNGRGGSSNDYHFEFEICDDRYVITFNAIRIRYNIDQDIIIYNEKIEHFLGALEENGENDKINLLYNNTLDLYSEKKGFGLLISLFLKLYKNKDLCIILMEQFKKMNLNSKDKDKNIDRKLYLKDFSSKFDEITQNAEKIIKDNKYNIIEYYGIILCYLNYYDSKKFISVLDELYSKSPKDTFEILLIYNIHFKYYPINKNYEFFDNFIKYSINKKDFSIFKIGLSYIKDMENFLNVIDTNKEEIYKIYFESKKDINNKEKYIIKLEKNLNFKKEQKKSGGEKYPIIIDYIKSIINYSNDNDILLIQFTSDFWNYILNCYEEPLMDNITICDKLRKEFINYFELVKKLFDEKSKIFIDVKNYDDIDEFTFILDQIIKGYINKALL